MRLSAWLLLILGISAVQCRMKKKDDDDDDDDGDDDDDDSCHGVYSLVGEKLASAIDLSKMRCSQTVMTLQTTMPVEYEVVIVRTVGPGEFTTVTETATVPVVISTVVTAPAVTVTEGQAHTYTTTTTKSDTTTEKTTETETSESTTSTTTTTTTTTSLSASTIPSADYDAGSGVCLDYRSVQGTAIEFDAVLDINGGDALTPEQCYNYCKYSPAYNGENPWYFGLRGTMNIRVGNQQIPADECICLSSLPTTNATNCYTGANGQQYGFGSTTPYSMWVYTADTSP